MISRQEVVLDCFNPALELPYNLRRIDFQSAMADVYDFLYDVNRHLEEKQLPKLEDMLRQANYSGTISDMLTESMAKHSRSLARPSNADR